MTVHYQSSRRFRIWAYTASHNSLLVRSEMMYPDQEGYSEEISYNIDMEFWAVTYVNLPTSFSAPIIREITGASIPANLDPGLYRLQEKVFEISVGQHKYCVVAGGILIGTNKWENEDRTRDFGLNLKHDKIIMSSIPL